MRVDELRKRLENIPGDYEVYAMDPFEEDIEPVIGVIVDEDDRSIEISTTSDE